MTQKQLYTMLDKLRKESNKTPCTSEAYKRDYGNAIFALKMLCKYVENKREIK